MAARYCVRASLQVSGEPEKRGKMIAYLLAPQELWYHLQPVPILFYYLPLAFFICSFAALVNCSQ
jgi:hypothetical protein